MRPTRRWRSIAALAGGLFLVAVLTLRITPAAIGLAAMVYLAHTRWAAKAAFQATRLRLERRIQADTVHREAPVEVVLDAEDTRLPHGVGLVVEDEPPETWELLQGAPRVRGATRRTYVLEPRASGSARFERVHVELTDARGLWRHEETVGLATQTRVLPSRERLMAGRRLARRNPLEARAKDRQGTVMKELEFDSLRPYQASDRLRDVDWKRLARYQELMTREFEREGQAPVVFLVDAGRTMRQATGEEASKLDFASDLVLELAESASSQGNAVGMVAFDELRVVEAQRPTQARNAPKRLADRVAALPGRVRARRRLDVGLPEDRVVDEVELDVLERLAAIQGAGQTGGAAVRAEAASSTRSPPDDRSGEDETQAGREREDEGGRPGSPRPAGADDGDGGEDEDGDPAPVHGSGAPHGTASGSGAAPAGSAGRSGTAGAAGLAGLAGAAGSGFQRAVREIIASAGSDRVAVIAMTDLEAFPEQAVQMLGRLASRGHFVLAGILPGTWFLDAPRKPRARDLENAYKEIQTRRHAQRLLRGRGVRVLELGPWSTSAIVAEETRRDTAGQRGGGRGASPENLGDEEQAKPAANSAEEDEGEGKHEAEEEDENEDEGEAEGEDGEDEDEEREDEGEDAGEGKAEEEDGNDEEDEPSEAIGGGPGGGPS